jgi:hypothetical protein
MFLLDDAKRQFGKMLQFDALLLLQARRQLARIEERYSQETCEAEADEPIDLPANSYSEPT